ncbi:MAG: hypothetical protein GY754_01980 [bacterium]|nr:hypothetical protein [bacterium]
MVKFFIPGLILGVLLNIFLFEPASGGEIYPEYYSKIDQVPRFERSSNPAVGNSAEFLVRDNKKVFLLKGDGSISVKTVLEDSLGTFSGNGKYYATFQKTGSAIEFFSITGERFWKLKSREYPYLSNNGKLIFLLNGDHSKVRVVDYNGNSVGMKEKAGRMCTIITFSQRTDLGGFGFLDGSFYLVSEKGDELYSGSVPSGNIVKGMAISNNGNYAAVHYGNTQKDTILIIDIPEKKENKTALTHVHPVKTSLYMADNGYTIVIDSDAILYLTGSGERELSIKIPPKRYGFSSISANDTEDLFSVSYTMATGDSNLLLFKKDGTIIKTKDFTTESFLESSIQGNTLFLRGSDSLFFYRFHEIIPD